MGVFEKISKTMGFGQYQDPDSDPQSARKEAERILKKAREEAEELRREARKEADQLRADGEAEVARLREQMLESARSSADHIIATAQEDAARERGRILAAAQEEVREGAERRAGELVRSYLQDYRSQLQNDWLREESGSRAGETRAYLDLQAHKQTMCDQTDELKRTWNLQMQQSVEQLRQLQNELYDKMRTWQSGLYNQELQPLADCYRQLYCIAHHNPALTEQILLGEEGGANEEQTRRLKKLMGSLTVLLRSMENAMLRLGLHVYTPELGEEYDDVLHVPASDGDPYDKVVSKCISPGVEHRDTEDEDSGVPLIRAVVELSENR